MTHDASSWRRQTKLWASLRALSAAPIDLGRLALLRAATLDELRDPARLAQLVLQLGLNDEAIDELPPELHGHTGGLRIWQNPAQLAPYLIELAGLRIRSYLEIGIRHGGSFVATTEYLTRFHPIERAIGVDVIPCPSMADYARDNPVAEHWLTNTRAPEFAARLAALGEVDLVFIDSHHEEAQCRSELALVAPVARMIAFHDISNIGCPGVARVWQDLTRHADYACFEYVAQYAGMGPFMGIGLAIQRARLAELA